ncbi:MAG: transketolase [Anaerolineaceae bacterium]|nr:transketolase [Anaerolineaceae bacterium]
MTEINKKNNSTDALKENARDLRMDILEATTKAGSGHLSSSLSSVEILTSLFFDGILNYRSSEPLWPDRDRFIMSKGHAAPLLYAVLAKAGYFPREELWRLRQAGSPVQGHPILGCVPGVEATTGSLGQGISLGIGQILGGRLTGKNYRAYVLIGDGECQAGQIWESAMAASHYKMEELTVILDYNKFQEMGPVSREMALEPFADKWQSFGWYVEEVDGHDVEKVSASLKSLQKIKNKPSILIAHTIKGKGISFVEADFKWHGRAIKDPEQYKLAEKEILCA